MMLRGNLSTRPFYNERLVSLALAVLAVVVAALTVYNATALTDLSGRRSALRQQMSADQTRAAALRAEAGAVQGGVARAALQGLAASTRLANELITARTFSWTTFFGFIEETIPYDVRLTAVTPEVERGEFVVTMLLVGKRAEDVDAFSRALEQTGAFYDVTYSVADTTEDGQQRVTIRAGYLPPAGSAGDASGDGGRP